MKVDSVGVGARSHELDQAEAAGCKTRWPRHNVVAVGKRNEQEK